MDDKTHRILDLEATELNLFLEAIRSRCGYDFRQYARGSLCRRLAQLMAQSGLTHWAEMIPRILHDERFLDEVLRVLSITVTEMFRDAHVYRALRQEVVPALKRLEMVKIWHAGCATGEEVYSLAIVLKEEGLYDRARIYATDFNNDALHTAQTGIYAYQTIRKATTNYVASGGTGSFANYYHAEYGSVKMQEDLKANIRFSHHNLATDSAFSDVNLILCRNVLIYFDRSLQDQVFSTFASGLQEDGFLCLGPMETPHLSSERDSFEEFAPAERVYRRMGGVPVATMLEGRIA